MIKLPLLAAFTLALCLSAAQAQIEPAMLMTVTSTEFSEGALIPDEFTCEGKDASPPLEIARVPEETKSLALVVEDHDAPQGIFTHWLVWNIEPNRLQFLTGTPPAGSEQGTNDFGKAGYRGPCPPSGVHRYYFTAYALSEKLDLPATVKRGELLKAMQGKVLKEATLIGKFAHEREGLK